MVGMTISENRFYDIDFLFSPFLHIRNNNYIKIKPKITYTRVRNGRVVRLPFFQSNAPILRGNVL